MTKNLTREERIALNNAIASAHDVAEMLAETLTESALWEAAGETRPIDRDAASACAYDLGTEVQSAIADLEHLGDVLDVLANELMGTR